MTDPIQTANAWMQHQMSQQPVALRLADAMDNCGLIVDNELRDQIADELLRLHSVNAQLLEALELAVATCFDSYAHEQVMSRPEHFVNQAIAAAKGEA